MNYLTYPLREGYVANWLVAGPQVSPQPFASTDESGIEGMPVERGPLGTGAYRAGAHEGTWAYLACPEDNFVDHSGSYPAGYHLRSWAYAELVADTAQEVSFELTACGPAGIWLDDALILRAERGSTQLRVQLTGGVNRVMLCFERTAVGATPHAAALRIQSEGVHVRIPTLIENVGRRAAFEQLTAGTYVDRDVYEGDAPVVLRWPEGERAFCPAHVRLHGANDAIYALADVAGERGDSTQLGYALQLPAGPMRVTLMPSPDEVYLQNTRIAHHLPLWSMGRQRYSARPAASDLPSRRREALLALTEYGDSLFGNIARMVLGRWADVDTPVLVRAVEEFGQIHLVVVVGMLARFATRAEFPVEVTRSAEAVVFGYRDWFAQGDEASRILRHTAEILAGQCYPDRTFADGQRGAQHRAHGEGLALDWLNTFASRGSTHPGVSHVMEQEVVALSHLSDLAELPAVYEMAAVCLDKLLLMLAVCSRQGVLESASPATPPSFIKSGFLQPTTPINRLLWGTGIYNHHLAGVLSLACASDYDPPPILESIALDAPEHMWSTERHRPSEIETSVVSFKTPDYTLSSLANMEAGAGGVSENAWRAALSPEAVLFANHPGSSSESDSRVPGFWAGNARLPRVGQWRDALIALHRLEDSDRFAWTHTYFPCAVFDEHVLRDGWAFARVGNGFIALTSSAGITLTREGRYAFRELRAFGAAQTWLVQMGRAALDVDFDGFQSKVLRTWIKFEAEAGRVRWTTLRGDELGLEWRGGFSVNGHLQSSAEWGHYDNAYTTANLPCSSMEIRINEEFLRLDFGTA